MQTRRLDLIRPSAKPGPVWPTLAVSARVGGRNSQPNLTTENVAKRGRMYANATLASRLYKAAALSVLPAMLLTGCGAARPVRYYQLTVPTEMPQTAMNSQGVSLAVGPMMASHLYREDHIVYSNGPEQMGTYEYQRWTEPPTEMIQEVLVRELQASGRYRDISTMRSSSHTDYVLRGELYDFKEVDSGSLAARVTAEWELRDIKTGTTVWTHYYTHDEPVASKDVSAMVAALDRNVQRGVGDLKAGLEQYFATAAPTGTPTK